VADVRVADPVKDTAVRRTRATTSDGWSSWKQTSDEQHLVGGFNESKLGQHVALLNFDFNPLLVNVKKVTKAELHIFTAGDHSGMKTAVTAATTKGLRVSTLPKAWAADAGGEGNWSGDIDQAVMVYGTTYVAYGHVSDIALHENVIDVMPLVRAVLPDEVLDSNNKPGLGKTNHGWHLSVSGGSPDYYKHEWVAASKDHPNIAIRPFVTLTVELKGGPGITRLDTPDGDVEAGSDVFLRGEYEPGVAGDIIKVVQVVISDPAQAGATVWTTTKSPDNTGIETSTFAVKVDPAKLKSGTPYEWTARVQNQDGEWTPYAPVRAAIRYLSSVPTLSLPYAPVGNLSNLLAKPFQATWTSSTQRASVMQVQLRSYIAPTDPTWEEDLLWDSGRVTVPLSTPLVDTTPPPYVQKLSLSYGGPLLPPGTYGYRMQAKDRFNAETDWKYGQVTLTAPYVEQPGGEADLSQYRRDHPAFRIRIFKMGANRAPGVLAAEITDASNVGASEYFNAGGEFYFTIPATHPQVAVIEPYQVHYSLDVHTEEGWRAKAYGLITDFDATEDEVIFYGMDYLAVLARLVEERFDPTNAELPTDKGGAKYVDKTIDYIIKDQLNKSRTTTNSPLAFITLGDVPAMPEKVTIYASFQHRLPFIGGLIDSYRAGTGRKTRLVCERDAAGAFKWRVLNDPGLDRDNLRMEYGGLVQGFRTVPFSGWGTAVNAVGRTTLGTKVYSARKVAAGISEATYGAWPTTTMYQDIDDLNDLRRRTAQAAAQVAKVGKLMGIGIRVGSLGIKDMWDICDSVPILIQRGVVDTTRFGSGYWTIWGWNWQSYPDGHADLNLTLAPRQDTVPPNPDLIPSEPILDTPDFATGVGPPDDTAYPPVYSMAPFLYLDVETGDVYEKDEDTGEWEVTGSLAGPAGPEGPPGPEGPEGPPGTGTSDTVPPPPPEILSVEPNTVLNVDGSSMTTFVVMAGYAVPPVGLTDLDRFFLESTRFPQAADSSLPDWSKATVWYSQSEDATGTLPTPIVQPSVLAAETYWLRVYAIDQTGNRSVASVPLTVLSSEDAQAPPAPTDIVAQAGMSTIGLRWSPVLATDFSYTEVGWRESPAGNWVTVQITGTMVVITGLTNGVAYDIRLRSVDWSNNTLIDPAADPQPVPDSTKATDPEAGWVSAGTYTPVALPGDSLVWDEAMIEELFAGNIDADWITAGTLKVGGPGQSSAIEVYDGAGNLIGRWSTEGIEVFDPDNPNYKMAIAESSLYIYDVTDPLNPFATVSITPLGIDAASVTFGSARGGHNLIPNSSFELGQFSATDLRNQVWDVAADWNAAGSRQGADVNVSTNAFDLNMTVV